MSKIYEVKEIQPNNRGMFAIKQIKRGQKIMEIEPLAWATLKGRKSQICNWCLMKSELFRCSSCKCCYYCSKECQKKDWFIHKHECKIFQNMVNVKNLSIHNQIATEFVLNLRIALLLKHQKNIATAFFDLVSLQEHQPPEKMQDFQEMGVVLLQNLGEQKNEENLSRIMKQINIVSVNAFTVQDFLCETDGVAIGIYTPANYINHDCSPNCTQYFDGRYLNIVANRDIELKEQITISYTNPLMLVEERRKFLRNNYLFQCFCELCQAEQMIDTKFKYVLCPDCQGLMTKNEDNACIFSCLSCQKVMSKQQMLGRFEKIQKDIGLFEKMQEYSEIKKAFFGLKKVLSFSHPYFSEAIDKVYHATINYLSGLEEDKQKKLLDEAYILMKQQIKGIPTWYRLEEGQEKNIRFFLKYAHFGKLCYNLGKFQKAFDFTELANELAKDCHLKNKYSEVVELEKRFQELKIEASMAKSKAFKNS